VRGKPTAQRHGLSGVQRWHKAGEQAPMSDMRRRAFITLLGKLELLLAESLRVAHESGALRTKDLARVTVDTTVQPKNITFPTDAKLLHAAIK
jgi:transposase, IS5 family